MIIDIEGHPGIVRDMSSGAIVNTNKTDYENYLVSKSRAKNLNEKVSMQAAEIQSIKSDLDQIKQMLSQLLTQQS